MVSTQLKPSIHAVNLWQRYLLEQDADPACDDELRKFWVLPSAILVHPRVEIRRLSRAMEKLRNRHDSLRIRFERITDDWLAIIDPPRASIIQEIDLGDLDDATFKAEVNAIANAPMPLVGGPLAEMIVVRCGSRGDVIVNRVHHAITDGHGLIVLNEDLIKCVIGIPILAHAISHDEYIARFESPPAHRAAEIAAFWKEMHQDFPQAPNIGRKAKGLDPLVRGVGDVVPRRLTIKATRTSLARLESKASSLNVSTATALFAGYLEGLCKSYDVEQLMFVTHVGRTDPALDTYVGDHTLDPVIRYRVADAKGIEHSIKKVGASIMAAIAHLPSEAARRGTPYEDEIIAGGGYPGQFSAYQPKPMVRQKRSIFSRELGRDFGAKQKVGPYTVSFMDVSESLRTLPDLEFDVGAEEIQTGFRMNYDGKSYIDTEIKNLSHKICGLLDLEPFKMVQE